MATAIPSNIISRIATIRSWHDSLLNQFIIMAVSQLGPNRVYEGAWKHNINLFNNLLLLFEQYLYDFSASLAAGDITSGEFDTAMAEYDALYAELQNDLQLQKVDQFVSGEYLGTDGNTYPIKYKSRLDLILVNAGLQPSAPILPGQFELSGKSSQTA